MIGAFAILSPCETYRYVLGRPCLPMFGGYSGYSRCVFVMVNPSTADATKDDPTIRRCIKFATRWGYNELRVVNLFAFRSSHPRDLLGAADPVGPENNEYLADELRAADLVICAWGNNGVIDGGTQARALLAWCYARATYLHHLGVTKTGHPKHPLARGKHRIPDDHVPARYRGE